VYEEELIEKEEEVVVEGEVELGERLFDIVVDFIGDMDDLSEKVVEEAAGDGL
jgi:hypothetical protein